MEQTIEYKGYRIRIVQDDTCESPDDWGDDDIFLVYDHRQFCVEREGFEPRKIAEFLRDKEEELWEGYKYHDYFIFGVDAYIHSGVNLSLANTRDYSDRRWDVSTTGYILSKKGSINLEWQYKSYPELIGKDEEFVHRFFANNLINTWNNYLSGEVYGFIVEKPITTYSITKKEFDKHLNEGTIIRDLVGYFEEDVDWEHIDSCWSYYGEPEESGCIMEAKHVIDNLVKNE